MTTFLWKKKTKKTVFKFKPNTNFFHDPHEQFESKALIYPFENAFIVPCYR